MRAGDLSPIIGEHGGLKRIMIKSKRMAQSEEPILISGPTGTGKSLLAHHIHQSSKRKNKPFIEIPCSSINDNLIESELFGHVKGAYTGAHQNQCGKFSIANHGTIFLDEIGELSLNAQKRLLHFLQEGFIYRVGSHQPEKIDVRVIAATNQDLAQMVKSGLFRKDLYFRLAVLCIPMPSLKERGRDVLHIAEFLLRKISHQHGQIIELSDRAKDQIFNYDWPGNIRQLQNVLKRSLICCEPESTQLEQLEFDEMDQEHPHPISPPRNITSFSPAAAPNLTPITSEESGELEQIRNALIEHQGCLKRAAEALGMSRFAFYRRMKKFGITKNSAMTWYALELNQAAPQVANHPC